MERKMGRRGGKAQYETAQVALLARLNTWFPD